MFKQFCNKPFTLHEAQGYPTYDVQNAYEDEESIFKDMFGKIPL